MLLTGDWTGYLILGSAFLAVIPPEALYADLGQFGTGPIRLTWLGVVLPMVLNYFGQTAMLLQAPVAVHHTLYRLVGSSLTAGHHLA